MKKLIIATVFAFILSGCGREPTLDMTNEETAKASMSEMRKGLTPEDDQKLVALSKKIAFQAAFIAGNDRDELKRLLKEKMDGKTAKEIIEMGEK